MNVFATMDDTPYYVVVFRACLRDEAGATLVEYAILLFCLLGAIFIGFRTVGESLSHAGKGTSQLIESEKFS